MPDTPEPLTAEDAATLTEFARACKAAARAVLLYPPGHPAIGATVGRIVHITSADVLKAPLRLTVVPDGLLLGDRAPARPEAALAERIAGTRERRVGHEPSIEKLGRELLRDVVGASGGRSIPLAQHRAPRKVARL